MVQLMTIRTTRVPRRSFAPGFSSLALVSAGMLFVVCCNLAQAAGYGFSPPIGWHSKHAPAGYAGLWVNPDGLEAVNLATVQTGSLPALVQRQLQKAHALYPSMRLYNNLPYRVCGEHAARYVIWTSSSHAGRWIHEQVMAAWQDDGFITSYVRPAGYAPNPAARASILSVCGVGGASVTNPSGPQAPPPARQSQTQNNAPAAGPQATATPYVYPSLTPRYAPVIPM